MSKVKTFNAFFPFCGSGGGAYGFQQAKGRFRGVKGKFNILGGIDYNEKACADFEALTGVPATHADMNTITPKEIRQACGNVPPDIVFTSPPCKGFSGLLSKAKSKTKKYQDLNRLVLQGIFKMLEAWPDQPPSLFLLENVPMITTRGAHLLDQVRQLLHAYEYYTEESYHDCGELGGLVHRRQER